MQHIIELYGASQCHVERHRSESKLGQINVCLGGWPGNKVPFIAASQGAAHGIGIFWDDSHGIYIWTNDIPEFCNNLMALHARLRLEKEQAEAEALAVRDGK